MVFLKTSTGRIGYSHHSYKPWGPYAQFFLKDIESNEQFMAFAKDLTLLPEIEQKDLKSRHEFSKRERDEQNLQETIKKHQVFVGQSDSNEVISEPLVSLPENGYLVCNSCNSTLTIKLKLQCSKCKWPICSCGACRCGGDIKLHPEYVNGPWKSGITLDVHTLESYCTDGDMQERPTFITRRSELGELIFRFKYRSDQTALKHILKLALNYLSNEKVRFDLIVPVPPSDPSRTITKQIAQGLASGLATSTSNTALIKRRTTEELKSITDPARRKELLAGVFAADSSQMLGKVILLVDDLYRSGATLEAATEVAYTEGGARTVFVFAVTRTRVHR